MLAAGTDEAGVDLATSVSPSSVISCPVALFNPQPPPAPSQPPWENQLEITNLAGLDILLKLENGCSCFYRP